MSIHGSSSLLKKLPKEKLKEIVPVLVEMLPCEAYEREFGSWLGALIESGVLSHGTREEMYGFRCLATDGHECLSLAEKIIDDWFSKKRISHIKEPFYPFDESLNPLGNLRADWRIGEFYVEFFGLDGIPEYQEKIKLKRELAKRTGMNLVEVYPDDLYSLDEELKFLQNWKPPP